MASNKLQLQVILSALDKATAPLKRIQGSSIGAGKALKEARDRLKELNTQQRDITGFKTTRDQMVSTGIALQDTQNKMAALERATESHRTAQQALAGETKVHRHAVSNLQKELLRSKEPNAELSKQYLIARDNLTKLETKYNASQNRMRRYKQEMSDTTTKTRALTSKHTDLSRQVDEAKSKLNAAGISTHKLGAAELALSSNIAKANSEMLLQESRLKRITAQQKRLAAAKSQYERTQSLAGSMAGSGAAGLASGYAIAKPLQGIVQAFTPTEDAATQLKVSMMDKNGQVAADFKRITNLATALGDRLPGTTADFQEMMTMLRRQGMSAQSILGGTGEAAAYLGVQLKKPVAEAAEFAAKMQDATRTTEKDMMGLMDTIQRAYYLGVDDNNMLQGFTKLSPVMSIIKKEGLEATNTLAPLLVMMDQTGMAGESAGNAIRKVFQAGVDTKRFTDANEALSKLNAGFSLDFTDGKGEFGGLDNLFAQLEKLKDLTSVQRTSVMKKLFGDDAETLQVVNTLMNKGLAGYNEVAAKMQNQADLQTRVKEQLGTLANTIEAAEGSWSNTMAEIGATVAPELKSFINQLGEVAVKVKEWVAANPALTAAIFKTAAGLAMLLAVGGGITVMIASMLGPMAMVRYGMAMFGIKGMGLASTLMSLGKVALPMVATGLRAITAAAMANPIVALITGIALAASLIYANWDTIGPYFAGLWTEIKEGFSGGLAGIATTILNFSPLGLFYRAFAEVLNWLGVDLPVKFSEFGGNIIQGLVNGFTQMFPKLSETIGSIADLASETFQKIMGIHSPSRVFAELGNFTMQGLNQGLLAGEGDVLKQISNTAKGVTAAGADMVGIGAGLNVDRRPPISPGGNNMVVQGDTLNITINATPGTDTAGLRQMITQLLDDRERNKATRLRASLRDTE